MRIHPRDQAEFSTFIDQRWQKGEPSVFVEYRFNPNRQGEWLHVRHTASCSGSGEQLALWCVIENLPLSPDKESPLEWMAEAFRGGEAALSTEHVTEEDRIDDGDTSIRLSLISSFTDGLMRGAQRSHAHQAPNERSRTNRQPSRPLGRSTSSASAGESAEIVATPPSARQYRASLRDPQLEGTTILLVEDEAAVRKLVRKLLEMLGCNVIEAVSGREALDLWPSIRDQVTLLVSDVVMPDGVSGWDLAKELHQRHPALGILLTSGYDERPGDHALQDLPQIAFLQKPYEVQRLKNTLSELMQVKLGFGQAVD